MTQSKNELTEAGRRVSDLVQLYQQLLQFSRNEKDADMINYRKRKDEEVGKMLRYKDEEIILIQGIIDLYLEEDDGITLIDYKTDAASPKHILEAYEVQLRCYAMALARITGKPVKAIRIYSFHNRREIEVD